MTNLEKLIQDYNKSLQDATNEIMEFFPNDNGSMKCIVKNTIREKFDNLFQKHYKLLKNKNLEEMEYWI